MQAVRTLLGSLVGLALGIALLIVFIVYLNIGSLWKLVPVGLAVGYSMRLLASTGTPSYFRGALAAALTGAAAFAGPLMAAKVVQNKGPDKVSMPAGAVAAQAEAEAPAAEKETVVVAPEPQLVEGLPTTGVGQIGVRRDRFNPLDAIWLGASVLLAYEFGKGSTRTASDDETSEGDEAPSDESPEQAPEEPVTTEA